MATVKLTLIGLYNYDDTLFDGLQLPEYFDKQTLVSTILLAGGEFPCVYPNGDFMKQAISLWSAKNQRYFERLAVLMQKDYEPLENYNRQEQWTDTGEGSSTGSFSNSSTGTDEGKVSAFNSSTYENRNLDTSNESDSGTSSGSSEYENHRQGYARGNIGVMSSQDMWLQEISIVGISPYDVLAGDFINEFCVKLYV